MTIVTVKSSYGPYAILREVDATSFYKSNEHYNFKSVDIDPALGWLVRTRKPVETMTYEYHIPKDAQDEIVITKEMFKLLK